MTVCPICKGTGLKPLPAKLKASYEVMCKLGTEFTVAEFAEASRIKTHAAHRRVQRLVKLGVVRQVKEGIPAGYSVRLAD